MDTFRQTKAVSQAAAAQAAAATKPAAISVKPAAPVQPTLAQLIQNNAADAGMDTAFKNLFALWGVNYHPNETGSEETDPCVQATNQGLECMIQRGSWAQLRALNRPAILTLTDASGKEHQLVLARLDDEHATLELGEKRQRSSIAEVSRYWFGDFLLLWRPAVAGAKQLSAGMQGEEVRQLRHGLEQVRGIEPTQDGADVYDEGLIKLVEDFQRDHRLTVDGIAGVQTQMVLDSVLGSPGTPLLTSATTIAASTATHGS